MFIGPSSIELVYLYMYVCVYMNGVNLHTQMMCVESFLESEVQSTENSSLSHIHTYVCMCKLHEKRNLKNLRRQSYIYV